MLVQRRERGRSEMHRGGRFDRALERRHSFCKENVWEPMKPETPARLTSDLPPRILTPDQRLRVFVSSTLDELGPERQAERDAIACLHLTPVFFEAGARPYPPREIYRAYLAQSDVFLGIYWQSYGRVSPTMNVSGLEDEHRLAQGKPQLIYIKRPSPERDPRLQAFVDRIRSEHSTSYQKFSTPAELRELLENDLAQLLTDQFMLAHQAPASPSARFAPLPTPLSPLIDRTGEVTKACELLLSEDVALVTLTGTGGVGKTRLAIEVARKIAGHFAQGAAFVSLAPLRDPRLVVPNLARALHVSGDESREPLDGARDIPNAGARAQTQDDPHQPRARSDQGRMGNSRPAALAAGSGAFAGRGLAGGDSCGGAVPASCPGGQPRFRRDSGQCPRRRRDLSAPGRPAARAGTGRCPHQRAASPVAVTSEPAAAVAHFGLLPRYAEQTSKRGARTSGPENGGSFRSSVDTGAGGDTGACDPESSRLRAALCSTTSSKWTSGR